MSVKSRKQMVLAMEMLARSINDENIFEGWLICGVADGDIQDYKLEEVDDYYIEDEHYKDLMSLFIRKMSQAYHSGGLYDDGITSGDINDIYTRKERDLIAIDKVTNVLHKRYREGNEDLIDKLNEAYVAIQTAKE